MHRDSFCEHLLDDLLPALCAREPRIQSLSLQARDSDARARSPSPGCTGRAPFDAMVSISCSRANASTDAVDRSLRGPLEARLEQASSRIAAYACEETLYTDYGQNRHAAARSW